MNTFTRQYLIAALWSSNDESTPDGDQPLDDNYSIDDIAPDTIAQAKTDCARFQAENTTDLEAAAPLGCDDEQAAHDFWLTRNRHGAGFWDRGYGDIGDRLTTAAHAFDELNLYVGDDGMIHGE